LCCLEGGPSAGCCAAHTLLQIPQAVVARLPAARGAKCIDFAGTAARVQITRRQVIEPGRERPASVAERTVEIWSTPQGFLKAALAHQATTQGTEAGTEVRASAWQARAATSAC
jgi:hypothetical protein